MLHACHWLSKATVIQATIDRCTLPCCCCRLHEAHRPVARVGVDLKYAIMLIPDSGTPRARYVFHDFPGQVRHVVTQAHAYGDVMYAEASATANVHIDTRPTHGHCVETHVQMRMQSLP
jgi:hypothetical protein